MSEECSECGESLDNSDQLNCDFCGITGCEACIYSVQHERDMYCYKYCCQNDGCDEKAVAWTES